MKLTEGLFSDSHELNQPPGTYRFAKNVLISNVLGAIENEPGFTNLGEILPGTPIGVIPLGTDFAVFCVDDDDIGYIGKIVLNTAKTV